jgi:spermidine synthase
MADAEQPANPGPVEIKLITAADRGAVKKLYQEAGWWHAGDETADGGSWIDELVRGSFCFAGAFRGPEMIGMGRAVSDGVSDAYIQDVVVAKAHRGAGIGERIIMELINFLRQRRIGWIGLIAEPGTHPFYRKLGFSVMSGYTPMLLDQKRN